jgi:hypothetical protein
MEPSLPVLPVLPVLLVRPDACAAVTAFSTDSPGAMVNAQRPCSTSSK